MKAKIKMSKTKKKLENFNINKILNEEKFKKREKTK